MIIKDSNSDKIRIPCFTKFIRDTHVIISTRLNLPFNDTQSIDNSISDSIIKGVMEIRCTT